MKYLTTIVLISLLITACGTNDSIVNEDPVPIADSLSTSTLNDELALPILETYEDSIRMIVYQAEGSCNVNSPKEFFKNEIWTYCKVEENIECAFIEKRNDNVLITEEFILKNNMLVYALEVERTEYETDTSWWSCEYIVRGSTVEKFSSMGHGETELDEWEPESILTQWQSHKDHYNMVKNKR
ncbi:MAG: hypothetical protein MK066_14365 [Crocinitomicaceae bacterium]|nr:hypothetical protein [Crocinitomicaceae bacterium]